MHLTTALKHSLYHGYSYAYPHKTAYRAFDTPYQVDDVWHQQRQQPVFGYVHLPFCEMRCGFCNLFTTTRPQAETVQQYLAALQRQMQQLQPVFSKVEWASFAFGGGTPTYLSVAELEQLFSQLSQILQVPFKHIPVGIETSPATATPDRMKLLRQWHVDRISIGVQSFIEHETKSAGRPQELATVHEALATIKEYAFPRLNIDLIYGIPGQTAATWLYSLEQALAYAPQELFLYPLYVRPLTGLGKQELVADDQRPLLYKLACERLEAAGYRQRSMRMFELATAPPLSGPQYSCQNDGMLGLGVGARSYTQNLHYSSHYAVTRSVIQAIIDNFSNQHDFRSIKYGFELSLAEQQRRFVIQSLLQADGLAQDLFKQRFGHNVREVFPQLAELIELGLATDNNSTLQLTSSGLAASDVIGPWLYSESVQTAMEAYTWQ